MPTDRAALVEEIAAVLSVGWKNELGWSWDKMAEAALAVAEREFARREAEARQLDRKRARLPYERGYRRACRDIAAELAAAIRARDAAGER